MSSFLQKSPLINRIKRIEKELSMVDSDIRALAKGKASRHRRKKDAGVTPASPVGEGAGDDREALPRSPEGDAMSGEWNEPAEVPKGNAESSDLEDGINEPREGRESAPMKEEVRQRGSRIHDRRFADYLSTSFQASRPLRHERRIQRNKAILMAVLAVLALVWVLYRFF